MGRSPRRSAALAAALLAVLAVPTIAQVQEKAAPSRVGMLAPTAAPAAVAEFQAGFRAFHMWSFTSAAEHAQKAVELAPAFGLGRAYTARITGGPTRTAEMERAVVDAAKASPAEAVLSMAFREATRGNSANARTLFDAAVALAPNDPGVAVERALWLNGSARIDALREVAKKYVDDAPSRMWLAFSLTMLPTGFSRSDGADALEFAQAALRIAPNEPGAITGVAHVLERLGRNDEAMTYLDRATEMTPTSEYAFVLKGEILMRQAKYAEAATAFDRAIAISPFPSNRIDYRRAQAMLPAFEGKPKETLQRLSEVAAQAEAAGLKTTAGHMHSYAALIAGGARDAETAQKEIAVARALGFVGFDMDENEVIALALAGKPTLARQALPAVQKSIRLTGIARENELRMLNGLILVAEDKPLDALPELRALEDNNFARIGIVEAYRKAGKKAEADLARRMLLERTDFMYTTSAIPIAHFRLK